MISKIRTSLTQVGGLQAIIGIFAVTWGIQQLQQVVESRQQLLDDLSEQVEVATAHLAELEAQLAEEVPADDGPQ